MSEADLVADLVSELRAQLQVVANRRAQLADGGFDPDLSTAAAGLGRVLVAAVAERRQQQKSVSRELAKFPLEAVIDHLKSLPDAKRVEIAAILTNADAEEPLL